MIVKRCGGMTEFIPSPQEKREGLIRDHVLELVRLLHERLTEVEVANGGKPERSQKCSQLLYLIQDEESEIVT